MEDLENNIQTSFDASLLDQDLANMTMDWAELGIDALLKDGLLKEIPIVATISNLAKIGANIQDKLFLKKILSFLFQTKDVLPSKRRKMVKDIDDSIKYRIKVGEKLLYILDRAQDYEISEKLGILFRAYLEEKITFDEFSKAANVLQNLNKEDYEWFTKERRIYRFDFRDAGDLMHTGLFELNYDDINVEVDQKIDPITRVRQGDKFETQVDGGLDVSLSQAGKIILEIFNPNYNRPKSITISDINPNTNHSN